MTGGCMSRLFVDAMPPFVGTWDLVVGKGGILLGFSRNSLLRCDPLSTPTMSDAPAASGDKLDHELLNPLARSRFL